MGQEAMKFQEKLLLAPRDKTAKLTETNLQKNSLRGHNLQLSASHNFLEEQVAFSHPRQLKKDYTNEGTSPDLNGVNHARPPKVARAERFCKGTFKHVL
jgi:hypothetical protein